MPTIEELNAILADPGFQQRHEEFKREMYERLEPLGDAIQKAMGTRSKPATEATIAAVKRTLPGIDMSAYVTTETPEGVTMLPNPDHAFWQQDRPNPPPKERQKRAKRVWKMVFRTHGQPFTKKED